MDATFPFWHPDHSFEMSLESAYVLFEKFSAKYLKDGIPPSKEYTLEEYLNAVSLTTGLYEVIVHRLLNESMIIIVIVVCIIYLTTSVSWQNERQNGTSLWARHLPK